MGAMLFILGVFVGISVVSGFRGLVTFAVGKIFGFYVEYFRYMTFSWRKSGGYCKIGFSPICELRMNRKEKADFYAVVTFVIETLVCITTCILYSILMINLWRNETIYRLITLFFLGIGLWFVVDNISYFVFLFKAVKERSSPLNKKNAEITEQLKNGCTLDEIEVPDHRVYGVKPFSRELLIYLVFEFMKKLWDDDIAGTEEVVSSMEKAANVDYILKPTEYLFEFSLVYYNLLYFYSAVRKDIHRAEYFYGMLSEQLHGDKDANAMRVLAAYFLYVRNDLNSAKMYACKAEEALHNFPYRGERLFEDKLIKAMILEIHQREAAL